MFIRSFVFSKKLFILILILVIILICGLALYFSLVKSSTIFNFLPKTFENSDSVNNSDFFENLNSIENSEEIDDSSDEEMGLDEKKDFIKWVDFNVTADVLNKTADLDIKSHQNNEELKFNWIELLAYLACKNGGNFKNFKSSDLDNLVSKLQKGSTMEDLTSSMKYYNYYYLK